CEPGRQSACLPCGIILFGAGQNRKRRLNDPDSLEPMSALAIRIALDSTEACPADCAGAVVTGADYRGLGIVRSLGRRGIPVCVLREEGHFLGAASRYTSRSLRWPVADGLKKLEFLANLAVKEGLKGWALFPTTDELVML